MTQPTPLHLGGDAWLVRTLPEADDRLRLPLNALVLRGPEPVLVDTGSVGIRERWWEQVSSLVEPEDVRWIFLSSDGGDHAGNVLEALARCPRAVVVGSWLLGERLAGVAPLPLERCRWIDDGEHLRIGDRRLFALRPPAYDSPATRGLYDPHSGVYWAADCFGAAVPHDVDEAADLDVDVWTDAFLLYHRLLSPWAGEVEPLRWRAAVGRVAALGARTFASAHGPVVRGALTGRALDLLAEVQALPPAPVPGPEQLAEAQRRGLARVPVEV